MALQRETERERERDKQRDSCGANCADSIARYAFDRAKKNGWEEIRVNLDCVFRVLMKGILDINDAMTEAGPDA